MAMPIIEALVENNILVIFIQVIEWGAEPIRVSFRIGSTSHFHNFVVYSAIASLMQSTM